MKLCKDCKHFMPATHPLQNMWTGPYYRDPMCGHSAANRSMVDGSLMTPCINARGSNGDVVCGPDAKLFEQRPTAPEPEPLMTYSMVEAEVQTKKPLWRQIFG